MSHQYQPTTYYDWVNRTHGVHLDSSNYQYTPYDYYAGDEIHIQNAVFRNSQYVTHDNTHVRFLNKSDIHVYDTSSLVIHDSGTLTMHTSASPGARTFIVDEIGRVGIGMSHIGVHGESTESPSFDLDVRGQVGIEDYLFHNDNTETFMLFGSDQREHNVNTTGEPDTIHPVDINETNLFTGGIAMLQMKTRDTSDIIITAPSTLLNNTGPVETRDPVTERATIGFQIGTNPPSGLPDILTFKPTNDVSLENTLDGGYNLIYVDSTLELRDQWLQYHETIVHRWNNPELTTGFEDLLTTNIGLASHNIVDDASIIEIKVSEAYPDLYVIGAIFASTLVELWSGAPHGYDLGGWSTVDHMTVNKYNSNVDFVVKSLTNNGAIVSRGDGTEVVINEDGMNDTNFRVEGSRAPNLLHVNTSTNHITINGAHYDDTALFTINGTDDTGNTISELVTVNPAETIINPAGNDHNFRIAAQGLDPQQSVSDTGSDGNIQMHTAAVTSHALFVDATNGRVGIGHSNPDTTLHVAGSAHIEGDLWVKGVTNQIDTYIHATSAIDVSNIGTGPALTVTQSGANTIAAFYDRDVNNQLQSSLYLADKTMAGIGTDEPTSALHVSDTVENYQSSEPLATVTIDHNYNHGGILINSKGGEWQNHLRFSRDGTPDWQIRHPIHNSLDIHKNSLRFYTFDGDADVMTLLNSGNVGIGMTSPYVSLYVEDTDGIRLPVGTTAQRPVSSQYGIDPVVAPDTPNFLPMYGTIRYNKELQTFEGFGPGDTWGSLGGVIDIDRDTYWTALNDIDGDYYPDDPDHLRAFVGGNPTGVNISGSTDDSEYGNDTSSVLVMDIEKKSSKIYNSVYISGDRHTGNSSQMERISQESARSYYEKLLSFDYSSSTPPGFKLKVAIKTQGMNMFKIRLTDQRTTASAGSHLNFGYVSVEGYTYWEQDRDYTHTTLQETHSVGDLLLSNTQTGVRSHADDDLSTTSAENGMYHIFQLDIDQIGSMYPNNGTGPWTCDLLLQLDITNKSTRETDILPTYLPEAYITT